MPNWWVDSEFTEENLLSFKAKWQVTLVVAGIGKTQESQHL